MKTFRDFLIEKNWSNEVKTKWSPPEGLFTKSGEVIAKTLLDANKSKAMERINFYINRGGDSLSNKEELNKAKDLISKATKS